MKKVYINVFIVFCLFFALLFTYQKGFEAGKTKTMQEVQQSFQEESAAIVKARKKILDLQRIISNNNDECFNRVWPDDIISAVNP